MRATAVLVGSRAAEEAVAEVACVEVDAAVAEVRERVPRAEEEDVDVVETCQRRKSSTPSWMPTA